MCVCVCVRVRACVRACVSGKLIATFKSPKTPALAVCFQGSAALERTGVEGGHEAHPTHAKEAPTHTLLVSLHAHTTCVWDVDARTLLRKLTLALDGGAVPLPVRGATQVSLSLSACLSLSLFRTRALYSGLSLFAHTHTHTPCFKPAH